MQCHTHAPEYCHVLPGATFLQFKTSTLVGQLGTRLPYEMPRWRCGGEASACYIWSPLERGKGPGASEAYLCSLSFYFCTLFHLSYFPQLTQSHLKFPTYL
ncbi:hypothetical protein TRVL_07076 [Trypanosoma vivax]|nr:hypothetical protein TRVL_07076 [Trypanosoma vivax]